MDIETVRSYCLSLPLATEDFPFDETTLVLRVLGKIFACIDLEQIDMVTLKCDPDYSIDLRDEYAEIEGAWHWNKKYWNQISLSGRLKEDFIKTLIRHSYSEVVKKIKKSEQLSHPEIMTIK